MYVLLVKSLAGEPYKVFAGFDYEGKKKTPFFITELQYRKGARVQKYAYKTRANKDVKFLTDNGFGYIKYCKEC